MCFTYFNNNNSNNKWKDITREERYFCCELFNHFKGKENEFIKFLYDEDSKCKSLNHICFDKRELEENYEWELGFEVCFYRDYCKYFNKPNIYSQKRTFDLCLFSENRIIIVEAKVQNGFKNKQLESIGKDTLRLKTALGKQNDLKFNVNTIAICSSKYIKNCKESTKEKFNLMISWEDIFNITKNNVFDKANRIYQNI